MKNTSWFMVLFHAISGVISAFLVILLFAFVLRDIFDSPLVLMFVGATSLGLSYLLLKKDNKDFLEYFSLIFAFAGEILILFSLGMLLNPNETIGTLGIIIFFSGLFVIFPSTVHRFISALVVLYAESYFSTLYNIEFIYEGAALLIFVWLWLNEERFPLYKQHMRILGYALAFTLLSFSFTQEFWSELYVHTTFDINGPSYILKIVNYIFGLGAFAMIYNKYVSKVQDKLFIFLLLGTFIFYLALPLGLRIAEPIVILLLAFLLKNRVLMTLGTLGLLYSIFAYYNFMAINFISKSQMLLVFGITVLSLAFILHLYLKKQKGTNNA